MGYKYIENNIRISIEYLILRGDSWFESDFVNENKIVKRRWFDTKIRKIYIRVNGNILEIRR